MVFDISDLIRFWSKVSKLDNGCWLWIGARCSNGKYGCIRLPNGVQVGSHIFSYLAFNGSTKGLQVLHTCDFGLCVNPEHLFLGTQKDNIDDMIKKGRQALGNQLNHCCQVGSKNNASKLTETKVKLIKELLKTKTQSDVMRLTGVSRANIWCIAHGKSWSHL